MLCFEYLNNYISISCVEVASVFFNEMRIALKFCCCVVALFVGVVLFIWLYLIILTALYSVKIELNVKLYA